MSTVKLESDEPNQSPRKTPTRTGGARRKSATPPTSAAAAAPQPAALTPTEPAPAQRPRRPAASASSEPQMVVADPTREEVALRAYELYVARGRRDGHSDEDWVRAERELHAERERARIALRQPAGRSTTQS